MRLHKQKEFTDTVRKNSDIMHIYSVIMMVKMHVESDIIHQI